LLMLLLLLLLLSQTSYLVGKDPFSLVVVGKGNYRKSW
jgi:hypothetical protein